MRKDLLKGEFLVEIAISELWPKIGFWQVTQNQTEAAVLPNGTGNLESGTDPTLYCICFRYLSIDM